MSWIMILFLNKQCVFKRWQPSVHEKRGSVTWFTLFPMNLHINETPAGECKVTKCYQVQALK